MQDNSSLSNKTPNSPAIPIFDYFFSLEFLDIISTKPFSSKSYDLSKRSQRTLYFREKFGDQIDYIKNRLEETNIVLYFLAPKFAGKGMYSGMLQEALGSEFFHHISIGDLVRDFPQTYKKERQELTSFLKQDYRGPIPLEKAIENALNPDPTTTLPDSFMLSLLKYEIQKRPKKSLLIDGFPRTPDQVTYSILFRELIDYKNDVDMFVLINVPYAVLDARAKYRVVCPKCHNTRNIKLSITEEVEYDEKEDKFYLICDNPACDHVRMLPKPGDELGIAKYANRIKRETQLMEIGRQLHGIPKIELFNAIPVIHKDVVQDYELTPEYSFTYENGKVKVHTKPWAVKEHGQEYLSLLPAPVILQFLKQLYEILQ